MDRQQLVEDYFGISIGLQRVWKEQFQSQMGNTNMSFGQMGVLFCIYEKQPVSSKELTEMMHASKSSVAQLVDGLDQQGYITRRPDPKDRRIVYLGLSEAGEDRIKAIQLRRREFIGSMVESLSDDDLAKLTEIQSKMLAAYMETKKDIA